MVALPVVAKRFVGAVVAELVGAAMAAELVAVTLGQRIVLSGQPHVVALPVVGTAAVK